MGRAKHRVWYELQVIRCKKWTTVKGLTGSFWRVCPTVYRKGAEAGSGLACRAKIKVHDSYPHYEGADGKRDIVLVSCRQSRQVTFSVDAVKIGKRWNRVYVPPKELTLPGVMVRELPRRRHPDPGDSLLMSMWKGLTDWRNIP